MSKKSLYINIGIIVFVSVLLFVYLFFIDGIDTMISALKNASLVPMLLSLLMIVIYWLMETFSVHIMAKKLYPKSLFRHSLKTVMVGQLFNCITPFATGGQPMQAFILNLRGMPIGLATLSLFTRFIVYQTVLTLMSVLALVLRLDFFVENVSSLGYMVLIGFTVNFIVVAGLIMIALFPQWSKKASIAVISLLNKLKLIKNKKELEEKAVCQVDLFYENMYAAKEHVWIIVQMVILTFFQLISYFSIPYFICVALGFNDVSYFNILCSSSFVLMISSFVPLPGAALGAEGSFVLFFKMYFGESEYVATAMIIWRFITFYMPIICGTFFVNRLHKTDNVSLTSGDSK